MLPGPVSVPEKVLAAMSRDYGSGQVESDFPALYEGVGKALGRLMGTENKVVLMTGEGMLALWAALKSCLKPGDAVVSVGTGVFGDGIGQMAESIGCRVEKLSFPYNSTIGPEQLEIIEAAIGRVKPVMLTAVHCETPSGTLNPLSELGEMKKRLGVPLFYVDAVASVGGAPLRGDDHHIDLLLTGSQKCLSAPPSMSALAVSDTAWDIVRRVNYQGYDALLPFYGPQADNRPYPYVPYWHGLAALAEALALLEAEGLPAVFERHEAVARQCREGLRALGLELFPAPEAKASPTVTAALLPGGVTWADWRQGLRALGLVVGGSLGPMAGRVFRLGHMGSQADSGLMAKALEVIGELLRQRRL